MMMPAHCADRQARPSPAPLVCSKSDDMESLVDVMQRATGMRVGIVFDHWRIRDADMSRYGAVVLHDGKTDDSVELLLFASPGVVTLGFVRVMAQWIFHIEGWRTLVFRIPADDDGLKRYALRLGCKFEGREDGYSIWAMRAGDCRWLRGKH